MPEDQTDLPYLLCSEMTRFISQQLDNCAETTDPWESRHKFDALKPLVKTVRQQIETLTDEAELDTCRQQMDGVIAKGKRIAPDIPMICPQCYDTFHPEPDSSPDEPAPELCRDCRHDAQTDE